MREGFEVEGAVQLAVYALLKDEIEGCGHSGRVVVSGFQARSGFLEVYADQQSAAGSQLPAETRQEGMGFGWMEVSDGGTGEERERTLRTSLDVQGKALDIVGEDRLHLQTRIVGGKAARRSL